MCQVNHRIRRQYPNRSNRIGNGPVRHESDPLLGAKGVYAALCAPAYQRIGQFDVACSTVPARQVSGDFVAAFEANGSHFLALGDLMGKGLSAAMWLTHVLDLLRRSCERGDSLAACMRQLNYEMYHSRVGVPLTSLFLLRLHSGRSKLTYSCGGCPPAFFLRENGEVSKLQRGGALLGAIENATYCEAEIEFSRNDTLLVASDGITELHHGMNLDEHPEQVARHLRYTAGGSAQEIVDSVIERVTRTSPAFTDDLTVLAIQRAT